ncbi:MAG: 16S rRNA (uracil(1498)-N(3))-methyltransferase [Candidatus Sericytochromatia bacterium]|nr:16S rRNA (uracil(1498)-N(3))-methyltransferase [Candidatus Tanganyikabacteria bacterium]
MPRPPRFFLAAESMPPGLAAGLEIRLDGAISRQIARVLRLRRGDRILVHDGRGGAWESVLEEVSDQAAVARIARAAACAPEPPVAVTLFAAVLKGDRQDWLIQKAVELGVARVQPLRCARNVAKPGEDRVERWERIAREAAEQSERGLVPALAPPIDLAAAAWHGAAIVCTERSGQPLADLVPPASSLALFIGPEGGWEPAEIALLLGKGARAASLGPRILRAETAAIAALAALMLLAERSPS